VLERRATNVKKGGGHRSRRVVESGKGEEKGAGHSKVTEKKKKTDERGPRPNQGGRKIFIKSKSFPTNGWSNPGDGQANTKQNQTTSVTKKGPKSRGVMGGTVVTESVSHPTKEARGGKKNTSWGKEGSPSQGYPKGVARKKGRHPGIKWGTIPFGGHHLFIRRYLRGGAKDFVRGAAMDLSPQSRLREKRKKEGKKKTEKKTVSFLARGGEVSPDIFTEKYLGRTNERQQLPSIQRKGPARGGRGGQEKNKNAFPLEGEKREELIRGKGGERIL